jgi:RecB family exonuclease
MIASANAIQDASAPSAMPPERDYISFSAIRTYQSCPLRYFFRYVAGLPERTTSASLVFGSALHRALEFHFRELMVGGEPPNAERLMVEYQAEWKERDAGYVRFGSCETRTNLDNLADRMLRKFLSSSTAKPQGRILAIEETLRGETIPGLPDLLARVDLIVEEPDALVINDWKTSRCRWSADQVEESAEQLLLYADLARDLAPGKPLRILFAVLTKTKEVTIETHAMPVESSRLSRTKRMVERVWRAIEGEHFYPSPSAMSCPSCSYRDVCRTWCG